MTEEVSKPFDAKDTCERTGSASLRHGTVTVGVDLILPHVSDGDDLTSEARNPGKETPLFRLMIGE